MSKLLIIGLDGATFDLIEPWAAEGDLPHLGRLMREGAWGRLRSVVPTLTYPAWTSFATGLQPGNTGIFEFYRRESGSYREHMYRSHDVQAPTLWDMLSHHGMTVGLIGFPNTYPARPLKGFVISGIVAPSTEAEGFCYPADLFEKHSLDRFRYRIEGRPLREIGDDWNGYIRELRAMVEERCRVALTLMRGEPWDCLIVHEIGTDAVAHAMWRFMDPRSPLYMSDAPVTWRNGIREIYRMADRMVGDLMAAAGSDVITVVLSDHGNGPTMRAINQNVLLRDAGLLAVKTGLFRILIEDYVTPRLPTWLRPLLLQVGSLPRWLPAPLRRVFDAAFEAFMTSLPRIGPRVAELERIAIDFARTKAYAFGNRGGIYVNLRGREPQGIVPPEEYEAVRRSVLEALRAVVDAEGMPVFPRACPREAVYQGRFAQLAPDVLTSDTDDEGYFFNGAALDGAPVLDAIRPHCSGMHAGHGILLMQGPGLRPGAVLEGASIVDVAPTILHVLGLPVPSGLDGRVLEGALTSNRPVEFDARCEFARKAAPPDSEAAEEAILHGRLRDLGYVD